MGTRRPSRARIDLEESEFQEWRRREGSFRAPHSSDQGVRDEFECPSQALDFGSLSLKVAEESAQPGVQTSGGLSVGRHTSAHLHPLSRAGTGGPPLRSKIESFTASQGRNGVKQRFTFRDGEARSLTHQKKRRPPEILRRPSLLLHTVWCNCRPPRGRSGVKQRFTFRDGEARSLTQNHSLV